MVLASVWSVAAVLVLVPVAVIAADRFLPWGGLATLVWGPPFAGLFAGLVHRNVRVGLLTALAALVLGEIESRRVADEARFRSGFPA